jgi:hypothetical protein
VAVRINLSREGLAIHLPLLGNLGFGVDRADSSAATVALCAWPVEEYSLMLAIISRRLCGKGRKMGPITESHISIPDIHDEAVVTRLSLYGDLYVAFCLWV